MDYLRDSIPLQRVPTGGTLVLAGWSCLELAERYGTPLQVVEEEKVRSMCRRYRAAFGSAYPHAEVIYAGKAFLTMAICRLVEEEGLGLDITSGGELYCALKAGFPPSRIYFHGNNKSPAELAVAIRASVGRIVVDNMWELEQIRRLGTAERPVDVLLRVAPGVEAHTHEYIETGAEDSKFGFGLESGQAMAAVEAAAGAAGIALKGIHAHIGSQVLTLEPYALAARKLVAFAGAVRERTGLVLEEINLGGGLGIRYTEEDSPPAVEDLALLVASSLRQEASRRGLPLPRLVVEPGRSIVGEAGTTLYTVGAIKEIPGVRTYLAVDGGMADNPRVALYGARYAAVLANKLNLLPERRYTVVGRFCESGDVLIHDISLPTAEPGDILAVFSTGAYHYAMASNYNMVPRPAVVMVAPGRADIIIRRETYDDLLACHEVPARFRVPRTVAIDG